MSEEADKPIPKLDLHKISRDFVRNLIWSLIALALAIIFAPRMP